MKCKLFFVFVFLFVSMTTMGQVDSLLTDKKGNLILPQRGDYAIGISTNSIFDYLGNMFTEDGSNSLRLSLLNGATLYGKYFTSAETAIRAKVLFNAGYSDRQFPLSSEWNQTELHTISESYYNINFALGYEKRKGTGRFQFSYGPEFSLGTYLNKTTGTEIENTKHITPLRIGARVFGGAEYFFLPGMSVGGEIGFGINGDLFGKTVIEPVGNSNEEIERKNFNVSIGPDILGGQIVLLIHI